MPITVGCRALSVPDAASGAAIATWLLYPAAAAEAPVAFGAYELAVALDAAVTGADLPLVVISHGNASTPWVLRDLAAGLVRAGYAVALLAHPGDTKGDDALSGTAANLANRPRHVRLVVDAALAQLPVAPGRIAALGHSIGGYTAIAVAGGHPLALPNQSPDGRAHPIDVTPDDRVRAIVLLAAATPWLMAPGALGDVEVPILMFTGGQDRIAPPAYAEIVLHGVPDYRRVDHRFIGNAGHFSFLSVFPPALARPDFPPAHDPAGFDRAAFQPELLARVLAFLADAMPAASAVARA